MEITARQVCTAKFILFVTLCILSGGLFYVLHRRYKFDFFYQNCALPDATHILVKVKADVTLSVLESSSVGTLPIPGDCPTKCLFEG